MRLTMTEEVRKRLKEAANEMYPPRIGDIVYKHCDVNADTRETLIEGGTIGYEFGYKEAIEQAKKWLIEHINTDVECDENGEPLAKSYIEGRKLAIEMATCFEADMNKLWEEKK